MKQNWVNALLNNWPAKVFAVLAAVGVFFFHKLSALDQQTFSIPLNVIVGSDFALVSQSSQMVRITVRGPAEELQNLARENLSASADISHRLEPGEVLTPVQAHKEGAALNDERLTLSVEPERVSIVFEKKLRRDIPVQAAYAGEPAAGYEVANTTTAPLTLPAEGPASRMEALEVLLTEPIDLSSRKASFSTAARIARQALIRFPSGEFIEVKTEIKETLQSIAFENLDVELKNLPDNLEAIPLTPAVSANFEASGQYLTQFKDIELHLSVDLSDIDEEGEYVLPIEAPEMEELNKYGSVILTPPELMISVKRKE